MVESGKWKTLNVWRKGMRSKEPRREKVMKEDKCELISYKGKGRARGYFARTEGEEGRKGKKGTKSVR